MMAETYLISIGGWTGMTGDTTGTGGVSASARVSTPAIFTRAADWAHARPFGCRAGADLRRALTDLTGPPRIGACSLEAPVPLPASWSEPADVREVTVHWPVTTPGVDVVLIVHSGATPPRVRSRMLAGPALFIQVDGLDDAAARRLADTLTPSRLVAVRTRLLAGELRALATRHPGLAEDLRRIADLAIAPASPTARVAVIGPDAVRRDAVTRHLRRTLPGIEIVGHGDVEAVVAVAPERGWGATDVPTLDDATRRVGRLVSTAPLPTGVDGHRATEGQLTEVLAAVLDRPRVMAPPEPRTGAWWRAAERLEQRRRRDLELDLQAAVALARDDGPAAVGRLHALDRRLGGGFIDAPGRDMVLEPLAQSAPLALLAALAVGRLLWPVHPMAAVGAGAAVGMVLGWRRWRRARRGRWTAWATEQAGLLRQGYLRGQGAGGAPAGPQAWLRRALARAQE